MAGFITAEYPSTNTSLYSKFKKAISFGVQIDDLIIKNKFTAGYNESSTLLNGSIGIDDDIRYSLLNQDIGNKQYICYYDKSYVEQRTKLRQFSKYGELKHMIEIICDEAIIYDDKNKFCNIDYTNLNSSWSEEKSAHYQQELESIFNEIYIAFRLHENNHGFSLFKQYMIDGVLAFEIVYDNIENPSKIISFVQLDPIYIKPTFKEEIITVGNTKKTIRTKKWIYMENDPKMMRELLDNQIIYISYSSSMFDSIEPISYIEPLIRDFNILKTLENSRVIWNLMNANWRMKMVVPIGNSSRTFWEQELGKLVSTYNESIFIDDLSGEISIGGKPNIQGYKNYIYPSKDGSSVSIESIENGGPDLSNMDALKYFQNKLRTASNIPASRFITDGSSSGAVQISFDGADREEVKFNQFIRRHRITFQDILLKPIWISFCLKNPEFKEDNMMKSKMGMYYNNNNPFEMLKKMEYINKKIENIAKMRELKDDNDENYWDLDYLMENQSEFSASELNENKRRKEEKKTKKIESGEDTQEEDTKNEK